MDYFWQFEIPAKAADLWVYLADTARFNRQLGLAKQTERELNGKREVTTKAAGMVQCWVEEPWTWIAGRTLTVTRNYIRGLAKICRVGFHVEPMADAEKSAVTVYFGWVPANTLTKAIIAIGMVAVKQRYARILNIIAAHLQRTRERSGAYSALNRKPQTLKVSARKKLVQVKSDLQARGLNGQAIDRLFDVIENGDELEVHRLRVVSLAHLWNVPQKDLLLICLNSVRLGLLKLSWDVICPHCRGVRFNASTLGEIPPTMKCDVCDISSATDQIDSIEVTFRVHPSIRNTQEVLYCSAEPAKRNHIKVQQPIKAHGELHFAVALTGGQHRVRVMGQASRKAQAFNVADENSIDQMHAAPKKIEIVWNGTEPVVSATTVQPRAEFVIKNDSSQSQIFVVEEMWWHTRALLPREILSLQEFRDLVAEDYLKTDVKLALGEQTILFTDIVGSTRYYQVEGDAKAFREIKKHFSEVFKCIERHQGEIVKTIGDAVMAVFHHQEEGLAASIEIQRIFHEKRDDTPLRLRISLHAGPVIAVSLNRGIDYFGSTVNLCAKLQACAGAGEVALSEGTYQFYEGHFTKSELYPMVKRSMPFPVKSEAIDAYVIQVKDLAPKAQSAS